MNCIDYLKDISLSKDEEKAFNKYKNTLRINNIILLLFILFICIILPIGVICKLNTFSFAELIFIILIEFCCLLALKTQYCKIKIYNKNIIGYRGTITEKHYSNKLHLGSTNHHYRNIFLAGKINENTTIYGNCTRKMYDKAIVNNSNALFFKFVEDKENKIYVILI